jgi:hypothetical protein
MRRFIIQYFNCHLWRSFPISDHHQAIPWQQRAICSLSRQVPAQSLLILIRLFLGMAEGEKANANGVFFVLYDFAIRLSTLQAQPHAFTTAVEALNPQQWELLAT